MDELVYIYLILVEIFYLILAQDVSPQSNFSLIGVVFGIMSAIVVMFWVVKFLSRCLKGSKMPSGDRTIIYLKLDLKAELNLVLYLM